MRPYIPSQESDPDSSMYEWADATGDPYPDPFEWLAWIVILAVFAAVLFLLFER